ncbi:MAG: autotransporter domain-containing protein, partial [Opitutales bacterium]
YTSGSITFKATEGNEYLYMGNWAGASEATASDANGGFLYQTSAGATTFYTDASSSITIGDTSLTGYDSIAGEGSIEKTGSGTLTVNSSMASYSGSLTVSAGSMYYNNAALALSSLSIAESAIFGISLDTLNSSSFTTYSNSGTISLTSGTLTTLSDLVSKYGAIQIDEAGEVSANADVIDTTLVNKGILNITGGAITSNLTNNGSLNITGSASTSGTIAGTVNIDGSGSLSIVINSTNYGSSILDTLTGSGSITVSFDISDWTSVDLTDTTSIYTVGTDYDGSITLDSTYTSITIGDDTYTVSVDGSDILFSLDDSGSGESGGDGETGGGETGGGDGETGGGESGDGDGDTTTLISSVDANDTIETTADKLDSNVTLGSDSSLAVSGSIEEEKNFTGESDSTSSFATSGEASIDATLNFTDIENITLSDETSITSNTAITLDTGSDDSQVAVSGELAFESTDEDADKVAITLKSNNITLTKDVTATSNASTNLTAIYTETGTVNLADGVTVSAIITDANGNERYGIAITNKHGTTGGLIINSTGKIIAKGAVVANSDMTITTGTTLEEQGSYITTNFSEDDANGDSSVLTVNGTLILTTDDNGDSSVLTVNGILILTTDDNGNMGSIQDTGLVTGKGSIEVIYDSSVSNLVGETYEVIDATTLANNGSDTDTILNTDAMTTTLSDGVSYSDGTITIDSLSQLQDEYADASANELELATALDSIETTGDDTLDAELKATKLTASTNGVDSYIMSGNSYMNEVNSMMLSNLNVANVNRAREILKKPKATYAVYSSDYNEDEAEYLREARKVDYEYTSNEAQLQSINMLGSKDAVNGIAGYDYWSVGALASIDKVLSDKFLVGLSLGGVYSRVEGDAGDNANSTAFLANIYATLMPCDSVEIFANVGYAHFWNEASTSATSTEWDSNAINALVGIAYKIETGIENLSISPIAMLNAVYLMNDDATGDVINIDGDSYLSAKAMLGLEVEYAISQNLISRFRAMYAYEFGDNSYDYTYGLANTAINSIQYIGGETGESSVVLGFGLSYDFSETCSGYLDYNAYIYDAIITHTLNLSVGMKF